MSTELYPAAPNAEAFARAWLLPLAGDLSLVGSQRWTAGMGLPYRAVSRLGGDSDLIVDVAVLRIHTFAATYTDAAREADRTHRRMLLLAKDPLAEVTLAGGVKASCSSLDRALAPFEQQYGAETIVTRFIGEYTLSLRFAAA